MSMVNCSSSLNTAQLKKGKPQTKYFDLPGTYIIHDYNILGKHFRGEIKYPYRRINPLRP